MREFRATIHGTSATGNWYAVEQRKWYGWVTLTNYIHNYETAKEIIDNLKDSEK